LIESFQAWFLSLGTEYGVNPYIFGAIYVGAIPFFTACIAWLVRNHRAGKSITLPILCAGCCFISAYVYLGIVGRNIPTWVWVMLAMMIIYGIWSSVKSVRKKLDS
jgi:hypothetical protein